MKLKLAVQVIASLCAAAMEFLRQSGMPEFADFIGTKLFLHRIDKLFYNLNCGSPYGYGYKASFVQQQKNNACQRIAFRRETKDFLLKLEDSKGQGVAQTDVVCL